MTYQEARTNITNRLTLALTASGYTVEPMHAGGTRLRVTHASASIGNVGYISLLDVAPGYGDKNHLYSGAVVYEPLMYRNSGKDGRYKLAADGTFNLEGLLARIAREVPKVAAVLAARKLAEERGKADDALTASVEQQVGGGKLEDLPGVSSASVYKGLFDLSLVNLTPDQAVRVLQALTATVNA